MTIRGWVIRFAMIATLVAAGSQAQMAVLGDVSTSGDAEHFHTLRLRAGDLFRYASPFDYTGAAAQTTRYTRTGWHEDAPAALLLWRKQNRVTLAGTVGEAGVVRVAGRTRLIGDATWSLRPNERTGVEFLAAGDLIDTKPALERATAYTFFGVSGERQLTPRFTVIGLAGYQRFTDHNDRVHLRGRLIWMLVPEHGISAQLRWRHYESGQLDVGGAYFNPARYQEWQGGLAIRKRHAGWVWSGTLAGGREEVDHRPHATALAEIRAEGALAGETRLMLHASYNRSAGFAAADRYWYRVAGVSVVVPF